jgi:hypothetical protein
MTMTLRLVLVVTVWLCEGSAAAQSTLSTITGEAKDATGALVPDVAVEATHVTTGITVRTQANRLGIYTLGNLREGTYLLRAAKSGFEELTVTDIVLTSGDLRRVDLVLRVAGARETVEVSAAAGLIQTDRQTISNTRSFFEMNSLPLNTQSVTGFYALLPTYQTLPGTTSPTFAGSRASQFRMNVDGAGADAGANAAGTGSAIGNIVDRNEAYQEVRVDYVNNSAEFSRLAEVSVITKSGTNEFRGSAYWAYETPEFRARNPFTRARDESVDHRYGFSAGGPVELPKIYSGKNRTFWFFAFDRDQAKAQADLTATVPTAAWRNGDFSGLRVPIRNPFTGEVYQDGRIPASAINPVSRQLQERFYPLPNVGDPNTFASQNYSDSISGPSSWNVWPSLRVDHRISQKDSLYVRFSGYFSENAFWESSLPTVGWRHQTRTQRVLSATHTRVFGPTLLNELRVGYLHTENPIDPPLQALELVNSLGLRGLAPDLPDVKGLPTFSFSGVGLSTPTQSVWGTPRNLTRTPSFADAVTYFRGKHNLRMGGSLTLFSFSDHRASANLFGNVTFANRYSAVPGVSGSGHPYADFLFGVPTSASRDFPRPREERRRPRYDLFFQDEWKVTTQLTLNLGVRYDYAPNWMEEQGLQAIFDIERGSIVVPDNGVSRISPFMPTGYVPVVGASSVGLPDSLLQTDRNNVSPRLGFAYRPFAGSNHTVVRGGYGIYYDGTVQELTLSASRSPSANPRSRTRCRRRRSPFRRSSRQPAQARQQPSRCLRRSIPICRSRTASSGMSVWSTSGGAPASGCRTSGRMASRCGTRATSTRRRWTAGSSSTRGTSVCSRSIRRSISSTTARATSITRSTSRRAAD